MEPIPQITTIWMIGVQRVKIAITEAEQEFKICWSILIAIQEGANSGMKISPELLFSFQPSLCSSLFKLETLFSELCKERRIALAKTSKPKQKWHLERVKTLDCYREIVTQAMDVGKSIGDAFAWIFYQRDKELIRNHFAQQEIAHSPVGVGGRGEIEFIRQNPRIIEAQKSNETKASPSKRCCCEEGAQSGLVRMQRQELLVHSR
ncbi:MAG: hypothetical protein JWR26_4916, partial [Pedosphaera sp.]|nr:hypothetical protein [Pedosphaera sp.]